MKKTYQKPLQVIVTVTAVALGPASPNASLDATKSVNAENIESRRTSVWGIDDSE